jgi:hypothetical protein
MGEELVAFVEAAGIEPEYSCINGRRFLKVVADEEV